VSDVLLGTVADSEGLDWDEACQIIFAATGAICGEPATGLYRGACVHEHVSERWLCAEHAVKSHDCTACYRAAMPGQVS
jgi:hypothetical protein